MCIWDSFSHMGTGTNIRQNRIEGYFCFMLQYTLFFGIFLCFCIVCCASSFIVYLQQNQPFPILFFLSFSLFHPFNLSHILLGHGARKKTYCVVYGFIVGLSRWGCKLQRINNKSPGYIYKTWNKSLLKFSTENNRK